MDAQLLTLKGNVEEFLQKLLNVCYIIILILLYLVIFFRILFLPLLLLLLKILLPARSEMFSRRVTVFTWVLIWKKVSVISKLMLRTTALATSKLMPCMEISLLLQCSNYKLHLLGNAMVGCWTWLYLASSFYPRAYLSSICVFWCNAIYLIIIKFIYLCIWYVFVISG